jgi:hypothetical protein
MANPLDGFDQGVTRFWLAKEALESHVGQKEFLQINENGPQLCSQRFARIFAFTARLKGDKSYG